MRTQDINKLIAQAKRTNKKRDEDERIRGLGSPTTGPDDMLLRTAMCAFVAGMSVKDWNAVAEGYCMLRQLHQRLFKGDYHPV